MPDPEGYWSASAEAINVQNIEGKPYPLLSGPEVMDDLIDRTILWAASQGSGTEDELLKAAAMVLYHAASKARRSVGHDHDEEGNPI